MNGILGMTELALEPGDGRTGRLPRHGQGVRRALLLVINDLLDLSRSGETQARPGARRLRPRRGPRRDARGAGLGCRQKGLELACRIALASPTTCG
jgi:hypothetical protein